MTAARVVTDSSATGALGAGSYSYKAVYSGNDNYKSATGDCEPFKISQGSPTISTIVKDGQGTTVNNANPANLGTSFPYTTLFRSLTANQSANSTAKVTYSFYKTNDCT